MSSKSNVIILAGGFGTRLSKVYGDIPKPMAPIDHRPMIEHQIIQCKKYGFEKILILAHYKSDKIIDFLGNGSNYGLKINYLIEKTPLGTGGALLNSLNQLEDNFLVIYGDTFFKIDLNIFYQFHINNKASASLFLHPNDHPYDSDLVEIDKFDYIKKILPYPHKKSLITRNLVNAAIYFFKKENIEKFKFHKNNFDIAKDLLPLMLIKKQKIKGYISQEYIKDAGTPDRIKKINNHINNNLHNKLSLESKRSAVFIDRDGTINTEVNHLKSIDQFELIKKSDEAIALLNKEGFLTVVVTNQPVIARGELTFKELNTIHAKMEKLLSLKGAYLDEITFCPHHPDSGFENEIKELKKKCICRKPNNGLIEQSMQKLNITNQSSWMIGDRTADILAGQKSFLNTILLRTGFYGKDQKYSVQPDFIMDDLYNASQFIIRYQNLETKIFNLVKKRLHLEKIIIIGGLSRSGKSTLASIIQKKLEKDNIKSHIISLDSWLKKKSDRIEGSGVLERYKTEKIKNFISEISLDDFFEINIPDFCFYSKKSTASKKILIKKNDKIIIEGIPALLFNDLLKLSNLKFYVDIEKGLRHNRIRTEYKSRLYKLEKIDSIIQSRKIDEDVIIKQSNKHANFIIKTYDS